MDCKDCGQCGCWGELRKPVCTDRSQAACSSLTEGPQGLLGQVRWVQGEEATAEEVALSTVVSASVDVRQLKRCKPSVPAQTAGG